MIESKNVLITGSSKGLGSNLALHFAKQGYNIFLHGRDMKSLKKVSNNIKNLGVEIKIFDCDFLNKNDFKKFCQKLESYDIEILINNAGMGCQNVGLDKLSFDYIENMIEINLKTPIFLIKVLQKNLKYIININSMSGLESKKFRAIYSSSKTGLKAFSDCYKKEDHSIHVLDVFPTNIKTQSDQENAMEVDYVSNEIFKSFENKDTRLILDGRINNR